ncbi:MAG: FGGY-family carbohydrate kinase [Dehalococcoidia bacterium]|nr:FGGY-family carbohydrate kinase [Dehalococcoidia bacterium]
MKHFIVIDGGTQNIKAFIIDENGNFIHGESVPANHYTAPQPGFAELDAEEYLKRTMEVVAGLMRTSSVPKDSLAALAITTHRNTLIPIGASGKPVRPAFTWLDSRQTPGLTMPGGPVKSLALGATPIGRKLKEYQRRSRFNWLRTYEPDNYEKTAMFLSITSYIFHALTGQFKDSSSIAGLLPIDFKGFRWHPWKLAYDVLGVQREKLPPLISPAEVAGTVSDEGAKSFGVPSGLPVIIGAGDKQSELLGAGAITSDTAAISYGTAAVIEVLTDRYIAHPRMEFYTLGSAIPRHWVLEGFVGRGYWMMSWFRREFARQEEEEARKLGIAPEELLNKNIDAIPPGCLGLLVHPYWHPRENDPLSRGAIIGFCGEHTRMHLYRAIIEGITFELRLLANTMQKYTGNRIAHLRVGGGGSKSDEVMQITADIFSLPASRLHTSNLGALGMAIDAGVALKLYSGFPEAVAGMVRVEKTFTPRQETALIYDRLFKEVYSGIYTALAPLHARMAEIIKTAKAA